MIYGVLANAGVENVEAPFSEMTEDELDRVVDINFKGTFFTLQQASRTVIDGGRVIATASTIASYPPPGSGVYAATKAAVRLRSKSYRSNSVPVELLSTRSIRAR